MDSEIEKAQEGAKTTQESTRRVERKIRMILAGDDAQQAEEGDPPPQGSFLDPASRF